MLFFFLICSLLNHLESTSTHLVVVYGYPTTGVQWLYTYPGVEADYCWDTLNSNLTYDFGFYANNGTCYLTAYQFHTYVYRGSESDGRKVGFRVNGDTCPTGTNPPTYNNQNSTTPYHIIVWEAQSNNWFITPQSGCGSGHSWSIRGSQIVCYTIFGFGEQTYSSAVALTADKHPLYNLTSPIILPADLTQFEKMLKNYMTGKTKALAITDGKRTDACNTAEMINTSACQYIFDFLDPTNPMHSYYTWVDQPQISTEKQCVGIYITTDTTLSEYGKFDFFQCEQACSDDDCFRFATIAIVN